MKATNDLYFYEYFYEWIEMYKKGAIRPVTYRKYLVTAQRLKEIAPDLKVCDLDKRKYQGIINKYAETHEKQTTVDFHRHLKSVISDVIDEGILTVNPTRGITLKGKPPTKKKIKYISEFELQRLLGSLEISSSVNWDWLILLAAAAGMRVSEILGLTPADVDSERNTLTINKTWDYKDGNCFVPTKNQSSIRKVQIDKLTCKELYETVKGMKQDKPIFAQDEKRVFISTINSRLKAVCKKANIPVITVHALRHTHASMLMYAGVSIASVSRRLGHSNTTTTQNIYLHIIKELEDKDNGKVEKVLSDYYRRAVRQPQSPDMEECTC